MQKTHPSEQPEGDNNSQALNPEANPASVSITTTTTTNPDLETENMNTTISTITAGATFTGIVESKNQHGANIAIGEQTAFLPVGEMGETAIGDLAKGSEVAVTVIDTEGSKPRVAIAKPEVAETIVEAVAEAAELGADAVVDDASGDDEQVVTVSSIDALAAAWGASRGTIRGSKPSSSKKSKGKARPAQADTPAVATAVNTDTTETPAVIEASPEVTVIEAPAQQSTEIEAPAPVSNDTPKLAYLKSVKVGDSVKAAVKFKKDFGAFFVTEGGLGFGLLHVSEMPGAKPEQRKEYLDGLRYKQELTLTVVSVDLDQQRLGLSLVAGEKQSFFEGLKVGAVVEGTISGTKEIGAFINLGATTGFLHVSEVDGNSRTERDARLAAFKKGEKVELVVIDVNREKKEVRLSERRLIIATLTEGAEVHGTFAGVRNNNTVVVALNFGARGLLPKKSGKRYEDGEAIVARIASIDIANNSVKLV